MGIVRNSEWSTKTIHLLLAVVIGLTMATAYSVESLKDFMKEAIKMEQQTEQPVATAEWLSGGIKIVVSTTKWAGESPEEWAARHKENVTAHMELWPKDE